MSKAASDAYARGMQRPASRRHGAGAVVLRGHAGLAELAFVELMLAAATSQRDRGGSAALTPGALGSCLLRRAGPGR